MKRRPPIEPQDLISHLSALPKGHLFLTKPQMAGVLQISVRCVTAMMRRGELPYLKLRGRFVRFRLEDVQRHLTEHALVCNGAKPKETELANGTSSVLS